LQIFLRNIGASIGVMVMGLLINHGASLVIGMKHIYLFALVLSIPTIIFSFLIPANTPATNKNS
jgi:hypothetical protein